MDYEALVGGPARIAARALIGASILGLVAIALMVVGFFNIEVMKNTDAPTQGRTVNAAAVEVTSGTIGIATEQRLKTSTSVHGMNAKPDAPATDQSEIVNAVEALVANSRCPSGYKRLIAALSRPSANGQNDHASGHGCNKGHHYARPLRIERHADYA